MKISRIPPAPPSRANPLHPPPPRARQFSVRLSWGIIFFRLNIALVYKLYLTLIWMALKKVHSRVAGVIYDSQVTNRDDYLWEPPFPCCTPIGLLGVIYDSQPAGMHTNTTTNRWKLLRFDWKMSKTTFFWIKPLTKKILLDFVRNRSGKKILLLQAILSNISSNFREPYMPSTIQIRVK